MRGWAPLVAMVWLLQVLGCHALGGYPGTFYQIMLRLNKERKYARTAPSPSRLWAILDPAASLGSLSHEPLNSNRITRSTNYLRMWEPRQVQEETTLETNEASTENPVTKANTEATWMEETQTEVSSETRVNTMAFTGEPVTPPSPATEDCGGNITMAEISSSVTVQEGLKYEEVLATPGWEAGQYPESTECVWNLNVGLECQAGLLLYKVLEGEVRETQRCIEDYLEIIQPNGYTTKYCGPLTRHGNHVSGTDTWSSAQLRTTTLRFRSEVRTGERDTADNPRGFKLQVTYYCWLYNKDLTTTTSTTSQAPAEMVPQEGTATAAETSTTTSDNNATSDETGGDGMTAEGSGIIGGDADTTGEDVGTTGGDAGMTSGDAGTTGGEADMTGGEADMTGGEADMTGGEADMTGGEANMTGGEADMTGGETNMTGGEADMTGGDANTLDTGMINGDAGAASGEASVIGGDADTTDGEADMTGGDGNTTGGRADMTGGDADMIGEDASATYVDTDTTSED